MTHPTDHPLKINWPQRGWLLLFWSTAVGTVALLFAGFSVIVWWLMSFIGTGPEPFNSIDLRDPGFLIGVGLLLGSTVLERLHMGVATRNRPVTRRMLRKIERMAEKRRSEGLGEGVTLLMNVKRIVPELAGRMWRTQLVVCGNHRHYGVIHVTIPALALGENGQPRIFGLRNATAPAWLRNAPQGYRFHARTNLGALEEESPAWGYVMDFESGEVPQAVRS